MEGTKIQEIYCKRKYLSGHFLLLETQTGKLMQILSGSAAKFLLYYL